MQLLTHAVDAADEAVALVVAAAQVVVEAEVVMTVADANAKKVNSTR
jgi:hypothetical protein